MFCQSFDSKRCALYFNTTSAAAAASSHLLWLKGIETVWGLGFDNMPTFNEGEIIDDVVALTVKADRLADINLLDSNL